jgi:hypothetical protein
MFYLYIFIVWIYSAKWSFQPAMKFVFCIIIFVYDMQNNMPGTLLVEPQ